MLLNLSKNAKDIEKLKKAKDKIRKNWDSFKPLTPGIGEIGYAIDSGWYQQFITWKDGNAEQNAQNTNEFPCPLKEVEKEMNSQVFSLETWIELRKLFGNGAKPIKGCIIKPLENNSKKTFFTKYKVFVINFYIKNETKMRLTRVFPLEWNISSLKKSILDSNNILKDQKNYHFFSSDDEIIYENTTLYDLVNTFPGELTLKLLNKYQISAMNDA